MSGGGGEGEGGGAGIYPAEVRAFIYRVPVFMCRRLA